MTNASHESKIATNASVGQKLKWIIVGSEAGTDRASGIEFVFDPPAPLAHQRPMDRQHNRTEHVGKAGKRTEVPAAKRSHGNRWRPNRYVEPALLYVHERVKAFQF